MKSYVLLGLLLWSGVTWAGGREGGNGGMVIVQDNEVILADPFVKKMEIPNIGTVMIFSDELKAYLNHVKNLLMTYHISSEKFWDNKVFGEDIHYFYSETLPCTDPMELLSDVKGEAIPFACTIGSMTWFKQSLFERLNLKDQVLAIIHERLHSFTGETHDVICDFISILNTMLTLQNGQFKGDRRSLTQKEQDDLGRLWEVSKTLGFGKILVISESEKSSRGLPESFEEENKIFKIFPKGGGLVEDQVVLFGKYYEYYNPQKEKWDTFLCLGASDKDPRYPGVAIMRSHFAEDVFVGIGSVISASTLQEGVEVINSTIKNISIVGEGSKITNSKISASSIGKRNVFENVENLFGSRTLDDVILKKSAFWCGSSLFYHFDDRSHLENVNISVGRYKPGISHSDVKVHFKKDSKVSHLELDIIPFDGPVSRFLPFLNLIDPTLIFKEGAIVDMSEEPKLEVDIYGKTEISTGAELLKLKTTN